MCRIHRLCCDCCSFNCIDGFWQHKLIHKRSLMMQVLNMSISYISVAYVIFILKTMTAVRDAKNVMLHSMKVTISRHIQLKWDFKRHRNLPTTITFCHQFLLVRKLLPSIFFQKDSKRFKKNFVGAVEKEKFIIKHGDSENGFVSRESLLCIVKNNWYFVMVLLNQLRNYFISHYFRRNLDDWNIIRHQEETF